MNTAFIFQELTFKAVRSSGAGGQHVNKVSSKIELYFDVMNSQGLSQEEKDLLMSRLANRFSKEGVIKLNSSSSRSQHRNKNIVIKQLFELLKESLVIQKKRIATKPSRRVVQRRLEQKKRLSHKKSMRAKPDLD
ncbi:MAG: aminoacyl-tRNA hydrolase [Flavobacteriaceae bacterium]|nr:aminoacyl-tRNA hydrolase [Flavobacteriaceae bacterium]